MKLAVVFYLVSILVFLSWAALDWSRARRRP